MITTAKLGKQFGEHWALRDLDFTVDQGECLCLLGRNGAGKTTLIRMLTCQLSPTVGKAQVCGFDVKDRSIELRKRIGVMPESTALLDGLTGENYLHFVGRIHGLSEAAISSRVVELSKLFDMELSSPKHISQYSFGMKKKLSLGAAILHSPQVLFLDEPFEGLDPVSSAAIHDLLKYLHNSGITILMTSHVLNTAERLCTRFIIIHQGAIISDQGAAAIGGQSETLENHFLGMVGRHEFGALSWI